MPSQELEANCDSCSTNGDEWVFLVELVKRKPKEPKVKLPRLLVSAGKAPLQYGDPEDDE
jgi:hypothetical protein